MSKVFIKSLPLSQEDRDYFIEAANAFFEDIFQCMEPRSPEETRKLWDVGYFVDNFIPVDELPVERDYAIMMMERLLVPHVGSLAAEADRIKGISSGAGSKEELDAAFAVAGKCGLKGSIILDNQDGDTQADILISTAEALRLLATQIEMGRMKIGMYPVKTPDGKIIGEVHLEQYETLSGGAVTLERAKKLR